MFALNRIPMWWLIVSCCVLGCKKNVVEIYENSYLIERIYYSTKDGKMTNSVFYDRMGELASDSMNYGYDVQGNLKEIVKYRMVNGKYQRDIPSSNFELPPGCEFVDSLFVLKKYLRQIVDVCTIESSVLSDGEVKKKKKETFNGTEKTYSYDDLNAKFRNLSFEVQQYFYNQILYSYRFKSQDGYLLDEVFIFEGGVFKRTYQYDINKITIDITANYNDSSIKHVTKEYLIKEI